MKTSNRLAELQYSFSAIEEGFRAQFVNTPAVEVSTWQSIKAPQSMPEIRNASFTIDLLGETSLEVFRLVFQPNLPWADKHFVHERISGHPLNPGRTWREWPYANSADKHRVGGGEDPQFDHSYAERYWPRFAGLTADGRLPHSNSGMHKASPRKGIRSEYGDLKTLIYLMLKDPFTRQAYLPIWFPEDLYGAAVEGRRVPCSLGYHFMIRDGKFHCFYPMRSCDFIRHFRDDVYLTIRLQLSVLQELKNRANLDHRVPVPGGPEESDLDRAAIFSDLEMGDFTMHISSLHMFEQDRTNFVIGPKQR